MRDWLLPFVIATAAVVFYVVVAVAVGRVTYGRIRARWVEHYVRERFRDPVAKFEQEDAAAGRDRAVFLGALWPAALAFDGAVAAFDLFAKAVTLWPKPSKWERRQIGENKGGRDA